MSLLAKAKAKVKNSGDKEKSFLLMRTKLANGLMPFGKYRDVPLIEIYESDTQYLYWFLTVEDLCEIGEKTNELQEIAVHSILDVIDEKEFYEKVFDYNINEANE